LRSFALIISEYQHDLQAPLIVTMRLNKEAQDYFNVLRRQHFPAQLNYLDAHLTLFHHLPAAEWVYHQLLAISRQPSFPISASGFYSTGFGVACRLQSAELKKLHFILQDAFRASLTPQDAGIIHPHVTIQNKVSPEASKKLLQQLQKDFVPFTAQAIGIDTWLYLNGPWKHQEFLGFEPDSTW
jgi:2'-5' RNA ligase